MKDASFVVFVIYAPANAFDEVSLFILHCVSV